MTRLPIRHGTVVRVRYADTDKMGIVYNGNYFMFFEIGRTELLRSLGLPYVELERAGYLLPVLEAHAEYRMPAYYDDELEIVTTYEDSLSATLTMRYEILRGTDVVATGYTRHSFVRADVWKPTRPPRIFIDAIERAQFTPTVAL